MSLPLELLQVSVDGHTVVVLSVEVVLKVRRASLRLYECQRQGVPRCNTHNIHASLYERGLCTGGGGGGYLRRRVGPWGRISCRSPPPRQPSEWCSLMCSPLSQQPGTHSQPQESLGLESTTHTQLHPCTSSKDTAREQEDVSLTSKTIGASCNKDKVKLGPIYATLLQTKQGASHQEFVEKKASTHLNFFGKSGAEHGSLSISLPRHGTQVHYLPDLGLQHHSPLNTTHIPPKQLHTWAFERNKRKAYYNFLPLLPSKTEWEETYVPRIPCLACDRPRPRHNRHIRPILCILDPSHLWVFPV